MPTHSPVSKPANGVADHSIPGKGKWQIKAGFDRRAGAIWLKRHDDDESPLWVQLGQILHGSGITFPELLAIVRQAKTGTIGLHDMDELRAGGVPEDCSGLTVLDIGGWNGWCASIAKERGASRAICLDSEQWRQYTTWKEPKRYKGVEYVEGDFRDWSEMVDYVLFYNVLYHVEEPRTALSKIRSYTRLGMSLSTITIWYDAPVWVPLKEREWTPDDPTDFWVPSDTGLFKMLEITGWRNIKQLGKSHDRLAVAVTT